MRIGPGQVEAGLTQKVVADPVFRFGFPNSAKLPPPVLAFQCVSFAYSGKKEVAAIGHPPDGSPPLPMHALLRPPRSNHAIAPG